MLTVDDRAGSLETGKSGRLLAAALCAGELEIARALAELVSAGAVQHRRSMLTVSRDLLDTGACECYDAVRLPPRG